MARICLAGSKWIPVFFCAIILASASSAFAVRGLGISPTSQELRLQPGQTYNGILTIINDGGDDLTYTLSASDYSIKDASYQPDFRPSNNPASISPITWFKFSSVPTVVKAHQQASVPYKIVVPKDSATGGHYGVIFAQTTPVSGVGSAVVNKIFRVGSIFYLATGGELIEKAHMLAPKIGWFQIEEPFGATVKVQNEGNVHVSATGTAYAKPLFGNKGPLVQFKGEVLPSTTRSFELQIPVRQSIGIYKVTFTSSLFGKDQTSSRWVVLIPKFTVFILLSTVIIIVGYFLLKLVNYWFRQKNNLRPR